MQVCHIHFSNFPFHTTPIPYEFTKNLTSQGIQSHVIALKHDLGEKFEEHYEGIRITRVPTYGNIRNFRNLERFSRTIETILSNNEYDIVHLYSFRGAAYVRFRCRRLGNKWLFHLITGNIYGGVRSTLSNHMTKLECRFFDKIIVNTKNVGEWVLGDLPTIEIPPGVDFNRFFPFNNYHLRQKLGYKLNDIVAIYSGSISSERKLERLLQGFAVAHHDCERLKLLIIGSGDTKDLNSLAEKLNIAAQVKIHGSVPYLDVQDYINIADIGLAYVPITPEYIPQPALKTIEMLSSGKPVLATATKGNSYYIQNGENGLLVSDNPQDIANGLRRLIYDKQLRLDLSNAARNSVRDYDWERIVKNKLVPVYIEMSGN